MNIPKLLKLVGCCIATSAVYVCVWINISAMLYSYIDINIATCQCISLFALIYFYQMGTKRIMSVTSEELKPVLMCSSNPQGTMDQFLCSYNIPGAS